MRCILNFISNHLENKIFIVDFTFYHQIKLGFLNEILLKIFR
jgi:hypothetical protein